MKVETVLITGCAGLMGSRLADWIIKNKPEIEVIGIDDLSGGFPENVNEKVIFYHYDLNQTKKVDQIFRKHQPDVVYHFAAYAAEALSPFIRQFNYTNNVLATMNVINMCIKYDIKRLVFTSSMAVYGDQNAPFHEDMERKPIDPYGVAKATCEFDIMIAGEQHDLDWCILRPHNVYGIKQNYTDPYRNVVGIFMYKVLKGDPITVFGDGKQRRAFTYIDDVTEPMWKAGVDARASRQIINLGGIKETTLIDLANTVARTAVSLNIVDEMPDIIHLSPRHEVKHAFSTYHKSIDLLDFEHKTDILEGVIKMWGWVKEQPDRKRKIWRDRDFEIQKGLYDYWKPEALKDGYWKEK